MKVRLNKYNLVEVEPHTIELVNWLFRDSGAEKVSNYQDFCLLAEKLNTMGYDISTLPKQEEFDRGISEAKHRKMHRLTDKHDWW